MASPLVDDGRQVATAIVGASAPFVTTSYSRARLIRQMYACGLLAGEEADDADAVARRADSTPTFAPARVSVNVRGSDE